MSMRAFRSPMDELGEAMQIRSVLRRWNDPKAAAGEKKAAGKGQAAAEKAEGNGILQVSGCVDSQKAHLMDTLEQEYQMRLIVAPDDLRAREIYENYKLFDRNTYLFPAKDFIFYQADIRSSLLGQQRIQVLKALADSSASTIIVTAAALMNHMMPWFRWKEQIRRIHPGDELDLEEWKEYLIRVGYERCAQAEEPGQFAVRGGILDIFPMTDDMPVRIELWGDEVDSIRTYEAQSQRSTENVKEAVIYPAAEMIVTQNERLRVYDALREEAQKAEKRFRSARHPEEAHRIRLFAQDLEDMLLVRPDQNRMEGFLGYFFPEKCSFLDYLPERTIYFLDEPNRMMESALASETEFRESMEQRLEKGYILAGQADLLYSAREVAAQLNVHGAVGMSMLDAVRAPFEVSGRYSLTVHSLNSYNSSFDLLLKDLASWKEKGYRVILLCASRTRGERLTRDLLDNGLTAFYSEDPDREMEPGTLMLTYGSAHRGYEYPLLKFVVITETDIFGKETVRKRKKQKIYEGSRISSFSDLHVGDYVVHESYGLGIYRGIEQIEENHVMKDYMKIDYADDSSLYVPTSSLDMIQKYAGSDATVPKLNRLGGKEWTRTKTRVRTAVREIAKELLQLYAVRQRKAGFVYGPDTVWQREFEEMFPFEETEGQLHAIEETKHDMESSKIMDRLICGDVGYGKTEIALRAAFKAVQEGKQVAYLVPTTILAQQHYNTFIQRMKDFPVRVDLMCRFRTGPEMKKTAADLKRGAVDIVIGTHRLLSKDVEFKDLGLLVIDEEQRFGVTHKEKIKQLKREVDVLTMTATPIPRTLHMSLIGIRDMSVLEEAPQDRLPIQTFVMEYNEELAREAINRELARGGQVYYVYNRVKSIASMADQIAALVPSARVAYAHGQMAERELESIMYDFINGDIDVLVTTTIIETGLDIPNANTMIIHDADNFGLSQLYQLRGRIGRSSRTSFAFLMYRRNKMLRETAEKRLAAIREFTELGSGFRIAMRDLEIRGAGNLLGSEQHGHMDAVGYDLYCKLLNDSVRELKGELKPTERFETSINIDLDAYIPQSYIRSEEQKLDIYKRIAMIQSEEDREEMLEELIDRFGDPPAAVTNLLSAARLKNLASQSYLTEVKQYPNGIYFLFYEKAALDLSKLPELLRTYKGRLRPHPTLPRFDLQLPDRIGGSEGLLSLTAQTIASLSALIRKDAPLKKEEGSGEETGEETEETEE